MKSDRLSHSILDWASTQVDCKIAFAILMNRKTSQQQLENLFTAFDTHFELDETWVYHTDYVGELKI